MQRLLSAIQSCNERLGLKCVARGRKLRIPLELSNLILHLAFRTKGPWKPHFDFSRSCTSLSCLGDIVPSSLYTSDWTLDASENLSRLLQSAFRLVGHLHSNATMKIEGKSEDQSLHVSTV